MKMNMFEYLNTKLILRYVYEQACQFSGIGNESLSLVGLPHPLPHAQEWQERWIDFRKAGGVRESLFSFNSLIIPCYYLLEI